MVSCLLLRPVFSLLSSRLLSDCFLFFSLPLLFLFAALEGGVRVRGVGLRFLVGLFFGELLQMAIEQSWRFIGDD